MNAGRDRIPGVAILAASLLLGCIDQPTPASGNPTTAPGAAGSPTPLEVAVGSSNWSLAEPVRLETGGPAREPHLAVKGSGNAATIVVASYVYDPGEGIAQNYDTHELVLHRSRDGGVTWTDNVVPRQTITRPFDELGRMRLGDPVLAYGPGAELYLSGTAFDPGVNKFVGPVPVTTILATETCIFVARSDDDGETWGPALFYEAGAPFGAIAPDKQWSDVGPDGVVHLTWVRFVAQSGSALILYTRSMDGGASWEPPLTLVDTGPQVGIHAPIVSAGAGGAVFVTASEYPAASGYNLFSRYTQPGGRQLVWSSRDSGASFSSAVQVGEGNMFRFGHVAADPKDALHAVVVGTQERDDHRVWFSTTRDGGSTWAAPKAASAERGGLQRLPTAWIDADGRAHLAYVDDGWRGGAQVVRAILDGDSVAFEDAVGPGPVTGSQFELGEYFGLDGVGDSSWAAWVGAGEDSGRAIEVSKLTSRSA